MTSTIDNRLRRSPDEIRARIADIVDHDTPADVLSGATSRLFILEDTLRFPDSFDLRASARATVQGAVHFAEPDVRLAVLRLREFIWLMARDDVERELAYAVEHQGEGWPEICAIACHMDRFTAAMWGEGVRAHPEIAEWAAGLPVPDTESEPF